MFQGKRPSDADGRALVALDEIAVVAERPAALDGDSKEFYKIVYSEGVRAVTQQVTTLNDLRARVGAVIGAASVATAFLGGIALDEKTLTLVSWGAIGSFALSMGTLLYVLLPRRSWTFHHSPLKLVTLHWECEDRSRIEDVYRQIGLYSESHFEKDKKTIDQLARGYTAAMALLIVEIVLWLMDIGGR